MKSKKYQKDERGSVLIMVLLVLAVLTVTGIASNSTSEMDLQVSGNEKSHRLAFYSAESARAYVAQSRELYGIQNVVPGSGIPYPNDADPLERYDLSTKQSFNGDVNYLGSTAPPRGSGTQVGAFRAHRYKMTCNGYGPSNAESRIEAGFYRIGF